MFRQKYEYSVYNVGKINSQTHTLTQFWGEQGWDLVSVDNGIAYFKRPIPFWEIKQIKKMKMNFSDMGLLRTIRRRRKYV